MEDKIQNMYKLISRRVLQQAWVDAMDRNRAAELLLWMETKDFALWCDMAEEQDEKTKAKLLYRIYHDEYGKKRELLPMQSYILTPRFRKAFYPGASFTEAMADYQAWRTEHKLAPEVITVNMYSSVLRQHGLDAVGAEPRAKIIEFIDKKH